MELMSLAPFLRVCTEAPAWQGAKGPGPGAVPFSAVYEYYARTLAPDDVLLLFGKKCKAGSITSFSLDFCRPLSALAAFGIALSAFGDST